MILPHGNAEVERVFSMLSDVITKKRKSLLPNTVRALCVSKSFISGRKYTASSFPLSDELIKMSVDAHAAYIKRIKEESKLKEEKKRQQKENKLIQAITE